MFVSERRRDILNTHMRVIHAVPGLVRGLDIAIVMSRITAETRVHQYSIQLVVDWFALQYSQHSLT